MNCFLYNKKSIDDIKKIINLPRIKVKGIFSHLARADEDDKSNTYNQIKLFNKFIGDLEKENVFLEQLILIILNII